MTTLTPNSPTSVRRSPSPGSTPPAAGLRRRSIEPAAASVVYALALCAAWFAAGVPGAAAVALVALLAEVAHTPSGRRRVRRARR